MRCSLISRWKRRIGYGSAGVPGAVGGPRPGAPISNPYFIQARAQSNPYIIGIGLGIGILLILVLVLPPGPGSGAFAGWPNPACLNKQIDLLI